MPEPVRIAFRCFSDINISGTYFAPGEGLPLLTGCNIPVNSKFNFTEWWRLAEGENLNKPFDVGEELVAGLQRVLEIVSALY